MACSISLDVGSRFEDKRSLKLRTPVTQVRREICSAKLRDDCLRFRLNNGCVCGLCGLVAAGGAGGAGGTGAGGTGGAGGAGGAYAAVCGITACASAETRAASPAIDS